jgi:hypothetical protein
MASRKTMVLNGVQVSYSDGENLAEVIGKNDPKATSATVGTDKGYETKRLKDMNQVSDGAVVNTNQSELKQGVCP